MKPGAAVLLISGLIASVAYAAQTHETVNTAVTEKIKTEAASSRSQVMVIADALTNEYGTRLTGSPRLKAAGDFARKKLVEWKLDNVRLEPWTLGNGWANEKFDVKVMSDPELSVTAYPKAWTPGTTGPIRAEVVEAIIQTEADFARLRGKLKGKFALILPAPPKSIAPSPHRYTDDELAALAVAPQPPAAPPKPSSPASASPKSDEPQPEGGFFAWVEDALNAPAAKPNGPVVAPPRAAVPPRITRERVTAFYFAEGVAAMIEPAPERDGALVQVVATGEANPWKKDPKTPKVPPQIVMAADPYRKILESVKASNQVTLEVDVQNSYQTLDLNSFNLLADIPGTDKTDELVMLGAHLDSTHFRKAAADNAAGVAVVMEAARILKTLGVPMHRTVRLGLWTGEEQGQLGSRAFVDKYFINRLIYQTRPAHSKLSAYFNLDSGTGAIRGLYTQANPEVLSIFSAWIAPFKSFGVTTVSTRSVGLSDHNAFDNSGLPGFQFIQDPVAREPLQKDDLMRNAAIVATIIYMGANRTEPLPRKPLPPSIKPAGSKVP
jgi:carboxypeptidase Q